MLYVRSGVNDLPSPENQFAPTAGTEFVQNRTRLRVLLMALDPVINAQANATRGGPKAQDNNQANQALPEADGSARHRAARARLKACQTAGGRSAATPPDPIQ